MEKSFLLQKKIKKASISTSYPYKGNVLNLRLEKINLFDTPTTFEIIEHKEASVIIPITSKNKLVFIKQYRRAADKILLEFPAGIFEENEDPKVCAERELQEEIGFKPKHLIPLGGFYSSPGFCTEYIHAFIAQDLVESSLEPDRDEAIDPVELSVKEAFDLIDKNEIVDAKTIICLYKYLRWKNAT